jgi:eukaryotic translation initiation factor 2, subunit 2 beta, 38kDa
MEKEEEFDDLNDFSIAKKKKKKKKAFNLEDIENALPDAEPKETNEQVESTEKSENASSKPSIDMDLGLADADLDFNLPKKKKKKKTIRFEEGEIDENKDGDLNEANQADDGERDDLDANLGSSNNVNVTTDSSSWANSDRDYTYEELIQYVFNIIKEKNPNIIAGEKRRLVMRPPEVLRVGTKKTSFANFLDICKL